MKLGDRAWYTLAQLAERWGVSEDLIEHYLEIGLINIAPSAEQSDYDFPQYVYPKNDPYIFLLKEVERFEQAQTLQVSISEAPDYLDRNHKYYSEELAIAVEVWLDLFGSGKIRSDRGTKTQIQALLTGKGLTGEAIKRISTVVNPNKKGGAPVTSS